MNTKEFVDTLKIAVDKNLNLFIIHTGMTNDPLRVGVIDVLDDWLSSYDVSELHIKLDIAEGYNPLYLTNEQVGERYRLLNKGDVLPEVYEVYTDHVEKPSWWKGVNKGGEVDGKVCYRVPLEIIKRKTPLQAKDITPGSVARVGDWGEDEWISITQVANNHIYFNLIDESISFEKLMNNGWLIKRPNEEWKPCYHE